MDSQINKNLKKDSSSLQDADSKRLEFYLLLPNSNTALSFLKLAETYKYTAIIRSYASSKERLYHLTFMNREKGEEAYKFLKSLNLNIYPDKDEYKHQKYFEFNSYKITIDAKLCQESLIFKESTEFEVCTSLTNEYKNSKDYFIEYDQKQLSIKVLRKLDSLKLEQVYLKEGFPTPDVQEIHTVEKLIEALGLSEVLAGLEITSNQNGKLSCDYILSSADSNTIVELGTSLGDSMEVILNVLIITGNVVILPDEFHVVQLKAVFPLVNWEFDEKNSFIKLSSKDLEQFKIVENAILKLIGMKQKLVKNSKVSSSKKNQDKWEKWSIMNNI
jgi:hypothetical protein